MVGKMLGTKTSLPAMKLNDSPPAPSGCIYEGSQNEFSKQMDSNGIEALDAYQTDPTLDIQSNRAALSKIRTEVSPWIATATT